MSANKPFVSVVILCRDEAVLERTLDSVLAQTFPSIEIIVASVAEGGGVLSPAIQYFGSVDESQAWKFGASRARGEYLCFLESGDELLPTYIEKCVFLAENAGLGFCASGIASHVVVIRKATYNLVGGHDARVSPEAQDSDLAIRLAKARVRGSVLPEILVRRSLSPPSAGAKRTAVIPETGQEQYSYAALLDGSRGPQPTILLAMPFLTVGGAEAVISQICRQLKALGYRLLVISTVPARDGQGDTTPWFEDSAMAVYHLPRFLHVSRWPAFICYLIQQYSVDAIWQAGSTFLYDVLPQIRQLFPQIALVDQLFNPVGHTANYLKYSYLIDHVITEHAGMKQWLLEHGETEEHISVIPNGVNLELYSPRPRAPGGGKFVAGFVGRLSEEKGPDLFLDIALQLADRPDIEFAICGGGPMESRLRTEVTAKGLSSRVHFLGFIDLTAGLPCDVLIVCSRLDGRPNVVMESLAMSIPVIASRVGGIPEMMPEGSGGVLFEPGDIAGFANALRELADDPDLYRIRCAEARRHAERHFSFAEAGKRYASIFDDARKSRAGLARPVSERSAAEISGLAVFNPRWRRSSWLHAAWRTACMLLVPSRAAITWRNAMLYRRLKAAATDRFDSVFYLRMNPDVAMSGIPPLLHYVFLGYLEGRDPAPQFSSADYLALYPEVQRSGLNPLLHHLASGRAEETAFSD